MVLFGPHRPQNLKQLRQWAAKATQLDANECRVMLAQLDRTSAASPKPEIMG